mmetsp:Transcript_17337/g.40238  ORF Transcript_17337/g.40238 Transcript_17337/m.40238 type:complete len:362 (-) Transcript_17337:248-1333(-)
MKLTRKVFWQSFWYMVAFYVTLPFALFSYYWKFKSVHDIWILVIVGFIHPSQGIMNSLVYFQRSSSMEFQDLFLVKQARRMSRGVLGIIHASGRKSTEHQSETKSKQPSKSSAHSTKIPGVFEEGTQKSLATSAMAKVSAVQFEQDSASQRQASAEEKNPESPSGGEGSSSFQYPPSFHQDSMEGGGDEEAMAPPVHVEGEWVVDGEPWRHNMSSTVTDDSDIDKSYDNMFEAAREHWRLNFTDFDVEHIPTPTALREATSLETPTWFRLRRRSSNQQLTDDGEDVPPPPSEPRRTGSWFSGKYDQKNKTRSTSQTKLGDGASDENDGCPTPTSLERKGSKGLTNWWRKEKEPDTPEEENK